MELHRNPLIRILAVLAMIAAGIPLILCLVALLLPYVLALTIGLLAVRFIVWYRQRW